MDYSKMKRAQLIGEIEALQERVGDLERVQTEHKRAEEALRDSRHMLQTVLDSIPSAVFWKDRDSIYLGGNRTWLQAVELKSSEEVVGKSDYDLPWEKKQADSFREYDRRVMESGIPEYDIIEPYLRADGTHAWAKTNKVPLRDTEGKVIGVLGTYEDITERKRAEEQIQASLREKEVLLRKIHHRVKNNLQVISSLLDMRSMRSRDRQAVDFFTDARAKVHTMALIHAQLYRSERFDQIDMGRHMRELVNYLAQVYTTKSRLITPVIGHSDVYLSVTQAIPCALVLNEVVSNAYRHAFEEGQKGTIEVSMQRSAEDTVLLRVKDDGIGLPQGIDIAKTDSLGLKLIRNLVQEQLQGTIQVERERGTEFIIEFPILREEVEHA